eukprot:2178273-Alexandrium_andersonii.AAC.1
MQALASQFEVSLALKEEEHCRGSEGESGGHAFVTQESSGDPAVADRSCSAGAATDAIAASAAATVAATTD